MEWKETLTPQEFFKQIQHIQNVLQDDASKELYQSLLHSSTIWTNCEKRIHILQKHIKKQESFEVLCKKLLDMDSKESIVFYGIGGVADAILYHFQFTKETHPNIVFCDRQGETIKQFKGFPVITPSELFKNYKNNEVCISTFDYREEICDFLIDNGYKKENIFYFDVCLCVDPYQFDHVAMYIDVQKQYFDDMISYGENEVFVDVGVLNGMTSVEFAKNCPNYKNIYLFEPTKESYELTIKNLKNRNMQNTKAFCCGLYHEKTQLKFSTKGLPGNNAINENGDTTIDVDTLDNFFVHNKEENLSPPTLIKMDIEGAELSALKGGAETIKKYKPKLAICIYHKPEDITVIPAYILSLVPEYKLYIRHYSNNVIETVLYAICE